MKCVRVGELACTRCQRAKRTCSARLPPYPDEFEVVVKTPKNFNAPKQPRTSKDVCRRRVKSRHHNRRTTLANYDEHAVVLRHDRRLIDDLPSIYLTAPILAVLGDNVVNDALDIDSHSVYSSVTSPSLSPSTMLSEGMHSPLSRAEMRQLLKM